MAKQTFDSWEQLRDQAPRLLEEVQADPALTLAAAVNPLLALEELGYSIDQSVRQEVEDRLRFPLRTVAHLEQLRSQIFEYAGRVFDIADADQLARVLFDELGLPRPESTKPPRSEPRESGPSHPATRPLLPPRLRPSGEPDPLEALRGKHPVIEPLLEFRQLDASAPRLATSDLYNAVRRGKRRLPITGLRGRLKEPLRSEREPVP